MLGARVLTENAASRRDLIFVSYSHADKKWLTQLLKFSKPYFSGDRLTVWCDRQIRPGYKWLPAIEQALARTRLAVLLLSSDFLASEFILKDELPPLTAVAEKGECALLPIMISQCGYRQTGLKDYQFLHDAGRPLDSLPKPRRNAQWVTICEKLRAEAERVWGQDFERQPAPVQPAAVVVPLTTDHRLGRLHGVPNQRPNFLARDELATLRRTMLTTASAAVGVTSVGLYGMGGIGKTELAVALCHEEAVRRAFPDGIF